ncbi:hypothetical protein N7509_005166 [Penicillium cosmopolitanum]|uniref:Dihydrolipoamide acetyltransferase component of pyruvate dehydrogenase complex n=1 Tax=Penicillium cosmopolitanum TaxID=1131564 RepID=A0A9X0B9T8_9EURO|nr:uncharacterized protein N7509_005166 [Penicillium cosmopolitanum]KAJ5397053.1 hypothetical protein N7509_005166 [Penicillium cosmopolitanum]
MPSRYLATYRSRDVRVSRSDFHTTPSREILKPYLLADIGEDSGITECRVVQWFVKPGDRVSQFDAICEVQSDKASVEITSRYDGVIANIHHQADEMAEVGKPLLDIDVEESLSDLDKYSTEVGAREATSDDSSVVATNAAEVAVNTDTPNKISNSGPEPDIINSGLIVPAVRAMLKKHKIDIKDVAGSGKGGRVLKEDVQRYLSSGISAPKSLSKNIATQPTVISQDQVVPLTPIESQMFKVITRALDIPHFGYSHSVDVTSLISLQRSFNEKLDTSKDMYGDDITKLTLLPFLIKALSQAFLHTETDQSSPRLIIKASHNFGVAIDTPNGLLVPVVKDVQDRSIFSIAAEVKRLGALAKEGRLTPSDMSGATFTVSNIGSIGGSVVSPVIVPPAVGIVALGRVEEVPVFIQARNQDDTSIVRRDKAVLSWSADHRVLDGASVARCAQLVTQVLENIEKLGIGLR